MFVEFMRMSLYERPDLFVRKQTDGSYFTREEWLRFIFAERHEFYHRGSQFTYVPDPALTDDSLVIGRIGRKLIVRDNEPPEEGMHERVHPEWQASPVVIDPRDHADGQQVVMQSREEIGKPVPVFQSLVLSLNSDVGSPYTLEAFGIVDPETFWDFVRANDGEVVSVTFEAAAPNMFGGRDDFRRELRDLRDKEKAEKTKVEIRNENGLQPDTERMHQVVDYTIKEGGGAIKARTRRKKTYNSRNKTKRMRVPEPPEPTGLTEHLVKFVKDTIQSLFKK